MKIVGDRMLGIAERRYISQAVIEIVPEPVKPVGLSSHQIDKRIASCRNRRK
jgi:hypothetical protein